jgi:hypothetical protein
MLHTVLATGGDLKKLILVATLVLPTSAFAQQLSNDRGASMGNLSPNVAYSDTIAPRLPDFGYVVYDNTGKPVKAFGPNTPVQRENGTIDIIGAGIPSDYTIKTEDAPSYLNALATVSGAATEESDYTETIREVVDSINEGAKIVKDTLCKNPSRPSVIKVEVAGGFSFGVHGSITSTVDWDLDKICPTESATAQ